MQNYKNILKSHYYIRDNLGKAKSQKVKRVQEHCSRLGKFAALRNCQGALLHSVAVVLLPVSDLQL